MYAKYRFVLMFIAFGALAFVAGLLAPQAWRPAAPGLAAPPALAKPAVAAAAPAAASASPRAASSSANAPAPGEQVAVPIESLAVAVPAPARAAYALQAGQFASADAADALAAGIRGQGMATVAPIKAVDLGGKFWYVVPIGPYATLDEARAARATAALRLQLHGALPAIVLPPVPAS